MLAAVALSGCAVGIDVPRTEAPTPSSTPTPTPTPDPTRPALDEIVLAPSGIADVVIGAPVPAGDPALQPYVWDGTACADTGIPEGDPFAGYWHAADPGDAGVAGNPHPFVLITADGTREGPVVAVHVWNTVRTATGIGVGSTRDQLEAAYPGLPMTDGPLSDVYELSENGNRITFEVADDSPQGGGYWEPALNETVLWMWAEVDQGGPYGIAGSDAGTPCLV